MKEKDCPKQTKAEGSHHRTRKAKGVLPAEMRILISNRKTQGKGQHTAKAQCAVKSEHPNATIQCCANQLTVVKCLKDKVLKITIAKQVVSEYTA